MRVEVLVKPYLGSNNSHPAYTLWINNAEVAKSDSVSELRALAEKLMGRIRSAAVVNQQLEKYRVIECL
jgi:hypothetical protein